MGIFDALRGTVTLSTDDAPTPAPALDTTPVAVALPDSPTEWVGTERAARVAIDVALSIPAVRKAQHVIAGTIGTFALQPYDANDVALDYSADRAWLRQPSATRTRQWLITRTVQDLIWHDRAVWKISDRSAWGVPTAFERVHPNRISVVHDPFDPHTIQTWIIDGHEARPSDIVAFMGAGLGGLQAFGYDLLTIYGQLQAAAGRYARAPQPHAILENAGADLTREEIDALLDSWERARETRAIAYTNDVVNYREIQGYSARELQLVEAREHAALEVARTFALPAFALDAAPAGSSITYGNVVERRRDLVESLRPWMNVIEETLSLDDRRGRVSGTLLPRGVTVRFDATAYTRDDAKTRMDTWGVALDKGILTVDEVRAHEPLTRN